MITWRCNECNEINESDEFVRHKMDWCKCGETAVDAESIYIRAIGNVTFLPMHKCIMPEKGLTVGKSYVFYGSTGNRDTIVVKNDVGEFQVVSGNVFN